MYIAALISLFSGCGVPIGIVAAVVIGGWIIYASTIRRK
jgi:hypothetical protein